MYEDNNNEDFYITPIKSHKKDNNVFDDYKPHKVGLICRIFEKLAMYDEEEECE